MRSIVYFLVGSAIVTFFQLEQACSFSCGRLWVTIAFVSPLVGTTSIPAPQNIRISIIHRPIVESDGSLLPKINDPPTFLQTRSTPKKEAQYLLIFFTTPPLYDFSPFFPPPSHPLPPLLLS